MRPVDTSLCMQGANKAGIVDHTSVLFAAESVLKHGLQGDDSDLLLDMDEDAEEPSKEAEVLALSADVDSVCREEFKELDTLAGGNDTGKVAGRSLLKLVIFS